MATSVAAVTPDLFPLLGAQPAVGRWPVATDAERGARPVVVMSHSLWTTQFGADPTIVGRDLVIDGEKRTVIGVMPPRFSVPGSSSDLWVPLSLDGAPKEHNNRYLRVLGRRAAGVSVARANMELDVVAQRIAREFPADAGEWSTNVMSVNEIIVGRQFKRATVTLVGVVAFVLIIACANAANLQLARGAAREREMSVRAALGASRGRIARQLVTESIVIAGVASIAGLLLAFGGVSVLRAVGRSGSRARARVTPSRVRAALCSRRSGRACVAPSSSQRWRCRSCC